MQMQLWWRGLPSQGLRWLSDVSKTVVFFSWLWLYFCGFTARGQGTGKEGRVCLVQDYGFRQWIHRVWEFYKMVGCLTVNQLICLAFKYLLRTRVRFFWLFVILFMIWCATGIFTSMQLLDRLVLSALSPSVRYCDSILCYSCSFLTRELCHH